MATDKGHIQSELLVVCYLNGDAHAFDELAILFVPVMAGLSLFCGWLCLRPLPEHSSFVRSEIGVIAVVCALLAVFLVLHVKKRTQPRSGPIMAGLAFGGFVAIVALSIMMTGTVEPELIAAVVLVGVVIVCERVKTAELRIREHLLRQELRLLQLAEDLEAADGGKRQGKAYGAKVGE